MKRVEHLFPELLRKQPQKQLPVEEIVRAAWSHLAGRPIAARCQVFRLYEQTLIVQVPDAQWRKQLHRMEARLLARINAFVGRPLIRSIEFRVDDNRSLSSESGSQAASAAAYSGRGSDAAATPPRKGPARELPAATEAELENSASAIADPELRRLFLRTARKMMR